MEQANGKVTSPIHVRYMSGVKADIYRTSAGHIADNDRRNIGAAWEQLYGLNGGLYEIL